MVEEGLFDRFPVEAVFGMHNWPGMPIGHFAVRTGPMMAASSSVDARSGASIVRPGRISETR